MITIEKETGEIGSGLISFRGYDTLESDIMSTVRDMQGEPLNDRYITSAYVMSPIIKISKIKKDDAVYNAEYAFDFKGEMNSELTRRQAPITEPVNCGKRARPKAKGGCPELRGGDNRVFQSRISPRDA